MKGHSELTTVTGFSKLLALLLFALLPLMGFYLGMQYQKNLEASPAICTMEAKLCPDGSYVSRGGPHCQFRACP